MIESGAMAAVAMTFAEYAVRLVSDQPQASALIGAGGVRAVAIGAIVFLSIDQLPRRHAGQPAAERVRRVEGRGARRPDRRRPVLQRRARRVAAGRRARIGGIRCSRLAPR